MTASVSPSGVHVETSRPDSSLLSPPPASSSPTQSSSSSESSPIPSSVHFAGTTYTPLPPPSPVLLSFTDITYGVKVNGKQRNVLRGITGYVHSGSLLAILGPSGSGKTTLLDVLACHRCEGMTRGALLLNGQPIDPAQYRRQRGYVCQEDLFYSFLTVEETIRFAAKLRTPPSFTEDAIDARVDRVIRLLGIAHVRHARIGSTLVRGISGGEKKRCAVAAELVTAPSLLLLDEPTTGLDTFTALHLLSLLKSLARSGMAIVLSIHQPRASIYQLFDRVLLLNGVGEQAFFGPASEAVPFLNSLGVHSPFPQNPADFLVDAVSVFALDDTDHDDNDHSHRHSEHHDHTAAEAAEALLAQHLIPPSTQSRDVAMGFRALRLPVVEAEMEQALGAVDALSHVHARADSAEADEEGVEAGAPLLLRPPSSAEESPYYRSTWTQIRAVAARCMLNTWRDPIATVVSVSVAMIFALLIGSIYYHVGDDQESIRSRMGVLFFVMMNTTFSSLGNLDAYLTGRALYSREHGNGMYSAAAYYLGKMAQDVPFGILVNTAFNAAVYVMVGLQPSWYRFCVFNTVCVLVMLNSYALCLLVSNLAKNYATANITASLVLVLYLLPTGGMLVSLDKIPLIWRWIKYVSFVRYGFSVVVANEFTGLTFHCLKDDRPVLPCVPYGSLYVSSLGFDEADAMPHIVILIESAAAYLLLGYFVLRLWRSTPA